MQWAVLWGGAEGVGGGTGGRGEGSSPTGPPNSVMSNKCIAHAWHCECEPHTLSPYTILNDTQTSSIVGSRFYPGAK